jgi:hypothetical protein
MVVGTMKRIVTILLIYLFPVLSWTPLLAADDNQVSFMRVRTQFIAALGEPGANRGDNAQLWGLWEIDPGPRGVRLSEYDRLISVGGRAPAKWQFDSHDWWLEEHGLIMESPVYALPAGKYIVTGDREATTVLTIGKVNNEGKQTWELANSATLYDVTHLACRSARYTPEIDSASCTPASASQKDFPVTPGAVMPPVPGCNKQDYAVLFVIGKAID